MRIVKPEKKQKSKPLYKKTASLQTVHNYKIKYNSNHIFENEKVLNFVAAINKEDTITSIMKYCIDRFLVTGEQFIYLKRQKTDIDNKYGLIRNLPSLFPSSKFVIKNSELYIDGKLVCYFVPLSVWQSEKSVSYHKVATILYDGFSLKSDSYNYLKNETSSLLNFMDTVFRTRDNVQCICVDNNVSLSNPHFVYFHLLPSLSKPITVFENILIHIEERNLIENEGLYLLNNNNDLFNSKVYENCVPVFSISLDRDDYLFSFDDENVIMYVEKKNIRDEIHFDLRTNGKWNRSYINKGWKKEYELYKLVKAFKLGVLCFENKDTMKAIYSVFNKLNIW